MQDKSIYLILMILPNADSANGSYFAAYEAHRLMEQNGSGNAKPYEGNPSARSRSGAKVLLFIRIFLLVRVRLISVVTYSLS